MAVTVEELDRARSAFHASATHNSFNTGRYLLRYYTWGCGPPIVFIHGMADAAQAFIMVECELINRFTCVGYELPDGTTDGSHLNRYKPKDYVADLVALIDHLALGPAKVVGSSFGSTITLAAIAAEPSRFTHAVLQNGFAYRPLNAAQRTLANFARFWPGWFSDWPRIHGYVMRRIERRVLTGMPEPVARLFLKHGSQTPIRASALRSLAIDRTDLRPLLPDIHLPVLLITGDRDALVPQWCWEELERLLPRSQRIEFPGCGHYPQYTHPHEMAQAIARFIEHNPL